MSRQIKIDFYRVEMPDDADISFEGIIERVAKSADNAKRTEVIGQAHVRLQEATMDRNCWRAEMVRIRLEDGAIVTKLSGESDPIDLAQDEGLGEQTAFLYRPSLRVLVLQRNKFAVSSSKLAQYFENKGGLDRPIMLDPIYTQDALQRLGGFTSIRSCEVRMAGPLDPEQFREQVPHIGGMVDLLKVFKSPRLALRWSMGQGNPDGSLSFRKVIAAMKALVKTADRDEARVFKLQISGRNSEDERDILDLVEERLTVVKTVERDKDRTLPYARRSAAIYQAWEEKRDELRAILAD